MKNAFALLSLIVILLFTGCAAASTEESSDKDYYENHYLFKGESESWTAELKVDSTLQFYEKDGALGCDSNEDNELTVTYKGEVSELSLAKDLSIDYTAGTGSGGCNMSFDDDYLREKTFKIKGSSHNGSLIQKDETITVTVTVDGKTESFELKNQA